MRSLQGSKRRRHVDSTRASQAYRVIVLDASVRPCPQVQQIEAELVREEKLLSKKQVPDIWERWHIHVASRLD